MAFFICIFLSGFFIFAGNVLNVSQLSLLNPQTCLYDPVLTSLLPITNFLREHPLLKNIISAIDGVFIDFSMCSIGLIYVITAKSITFLPTIILFYLVRAVSNNMVIFPIPQSYIFEYPGVPSYFVDYRKLNDLYFSGHTGCFVIYILDCFQNKRAWANFVFVPFGVFTVFILLVEGIHYANDIVIGFACATFLSRAVYRYRYEWNLMFFKSVVFVLKLVTGFYSFLSSKIRQFHKKTPGKGEMKEACPSTQNLTNLENADTSSKKLTIPE